MLNTAERTRPTQPAPVSAEDVEAVGRARGVRMEEPLIFEVGRVEVSGVDLPSGEIIWDGSQSSDPDGNAAHDGPSAVATYEWNVTDANGNGDARATTTTTSATTVDRRPPGPPRTPAPWCSPRTGGLATLRTGPRPSRARPCQSPGAGLPRRAG